MRVLDDRKAERHRIEWLDPNAPGAAIRQERTACERAMEGAPGAQLARTFKWAVTSASTASANCEAFAEHVEIAGGSAWKLPDQPAEGSATLAQDARSGQDVPRSFESGD